MVRSDLVVLPEPNIDSDLGLSCGVESFSVEDFFSQGAVKAFVVSIFPRTAWIDLHWFYPNPLQPDCSYPASQFYSAYRNWCLTVGKKPKTSTAFKRAMESTPSVYQKRTSSGNCWVGIQPCFISV